MCYCIWFRLALNLFTPHKPKVEQSDVLLVGNCSVELFVKVSRPCLAWSCTTNGAENGCVVCALIVSSCSSDRQWKQTKTYHCITGTAEYCYQQIDVGIWQGQADEDGKNIENGSEQSWTILVKSAHRSHHTMIYAVKLAFKCKHSIASAINITTCPIFEVQYNLKIIKWLYLTFTHLF